MAQFVGDIDAQDTATDTGCPDFADDFCDGQPRLTQFPAQHYDHPDLHRDDHVQKEIVDAILLDHLHFGTFNVIGIGFDKQFQQWNQPKGIDRQAITPNARTQNGNQPGCDASQYECIFEGT